MNMDWNALNQAGSLNELEVAVLSAVSTNEEKAYLLTVARLAFCLGARAAERQFTRKFEEARQLLPTY